LTAKQASNLKPKSYPIPESFIKFLRNRKEGFSELPIDIQAGLAYWILAAGNNRRKHKRDSDYMSIGYKEIEKFFGRGGLKKINHDLHLFHVIPSSQIRKETIGYKLTAPMQALKDEYLAQKPSKTRLMTLDGKIVKKVPRNPISSLTLEGAIATPVWREARPLNQVFVSSDAMERFFDYLVDRFKNNTNDEENIKFYIQRLAVFMHASQTNLADKDFIVPKYAEGNTGRLYTINDISLQNTPRIIRTAVLHGSYDYDIENCHYAIFSQLTERYGYKCKQIDYYLANKQQIREEIAKAVGIKEDQAKRCLLALMFGAKLSEWPDNAIPQIVGAGKAKVLYENSQFKAIASDVKQGRQLILKRWHHQSKTHITNSMGKSVEIEKPANVKLAYIIQGFEVKALWAVIKLYPDEISLLMHDGFTSTKELDLSLIEKTIKETTGMELKMSVKKIELPSDLKAFLEEYLGA